MTARNRFFQVPHCNGMGHRDPTALAEMRGVKAEGGWAVVCTEEVEIHPTLRDAPYVEGRLWDDSDIPALRRMTERVHDHGALAGIELVHNGINGANLWSRLAPLAAGHAGHGIDPVQVRRMSLGDIADLRRWHRRAVARAIEAGFDLVYVYAAHGLNTVGQFLSPRTTSAPTATAAASRTGRGCCASCSRTRWRRPTAVSPWPAASPLTSCSARAASSAPTSSRCSAGWASCPTCGTSWPAPGSTTRDLPLRRTRASRRPYVAG